MKKESNKERVRLRKREREEERERGGREGNIWNGCDI